MSTKNIPYSELKLQSSNTASGTYVRIIKMGIKYKIQMFFGIIAIFLAAGFQLWIPILIGKAVESVSIIISESNDITRESLTITGLLLLFASSMR